ncbi:MAG TPA: hypothetical protein VGW12_10365 [Pyrinomonadaceae bacterium]|nr:hypothetical protein [Pyrinomonadaceae bacterium]
MNRIKFDPEKLEGEDKTWWEAWKTRAEKAKEKALKDYDEGKRPIPFNSDVWGELKKFLLKKVFHGKCAYCDSRFTGNSFGDAEHFRPKGMVTRKKDGKDEVVTVEGKEHPGYYWLAYDWRNLLPACQRCNSDEGKMNQFPVKNGTYVASRKVGPDTATLDKLEEPLLLHPYDENLNPDAHLIYGEKGVVSAYRVHGQDDPYGMAVIETCNLKRGDLEVDRDRSQYLAWLEFQKAMNKAMDGEDDAMDKAISPYESGQMPHSRAALQYVAAKWKERVKTINSRVLPGGRG